MARFTRVFIPRGRKRYLCIRSASSAKAPLVPPNAVAMSGETTVEIFGSGIPPTDGNNRLYREMKGISRKVLTKTLRRLEWAG